MKNQYDFIKAMNYSVLDIDPEDERDAQTRITFDQLTHKWGMTGTQLLELMQKDAFISAENRTRKGLTNTRFWHKR